MKRRPPITPAVVDALYAAVRACEDALRERPPTRERRRLERAVRYLTAVAAWYRAPGRRTKASSPLVGERWAARMRAGETAEAIASRELGYSAYDVRSIVRQTCRRRGVPAPSAAFRSPRKEE